METGSILFEVFSILIIFLSVLFAFSFLYYSFKIYTKSYTFNLFIKWIVSYLLLFSIWLLLIFSMSSAYGFPLSLNDIFEFVLIFFKFLLPLVILFYLLRIEERGFDYKYFKGIFISFIIYLVSVTYSVLSNPQISFLTDSFDIYIHSLYIILSPLFIIYTLKMVYNVLIKNKRIRYPIILLVFLFSVLLIGSIDNGIYKSLHLIYNQMIAILGFSLIPYFYWLEKLCRLDSKKDNVNQSNNEYIVLSFISKKISERKERFFNRERRIEKSKYALNDEIRDAINNGKLLELENKDLKQLKFMLVCANQEAENLKNESNTSHNWTLTGFTLMLVPSILILNSFVEYILTLLINLFIMSLNFMSIFYQIIDRFDLSTNMLIMIVMMYIYLSFPIALSLLGKPNSKLNLWVRKNKVAFGFYELFIILTIASFVILIIKWILSNKLDPLSVSFMTNSLLILVGLMLYAFGSLIISLNRKSIDNANKIILDLNDKIIFYEK